LRTPTLAVGVWAVSPESGRPPWRRAAVLAERIVAAAYDQTTIRRVLTLPAGYGSVRVLEAAADAPRRVPGDQGSYARFSLSLRLWWAAL
jgi:hypothetical protein